MLKLACKLPVSSKRLSGFQSNFTWMFSITPVCAISRYHNSCLHFGWIMALFGLRNCIEITLKFACKLPLSQTLLRGIHSNIAWIFSITPGCAVSKYQNSCLHFGRIIALCRLRNCVKVCMQVAFISETTIKNSFKHSMNILHHTGVCCEQVS